jgi:putative N6-adenine-specific DNA methylase
VYHYQKTRRYTAQIGDGVESAVKAELKTLGARQVTPAYRAVHFSATPAVLYAVNYCARLVSRVLAPLTVFTCRDRSALYRAAKAIDWPALFSPDQTFGVFANVSGNANLRHSKFAALCLKDAVVDRFRDRFGRRPDVNREDPDLWLNLHLERTRATIHLDTSGGGLHRRGYRQETVTAPMRETLAAAVVSLSGWTGQRPLYDPMCGSGTLLCEAMMAACAIPSGYLRPRFGFQFLPDFDAALWQRVKNHSNSAIRRLPPGLVAGSDSNSRAVDAARANCRTLPGGNGVAVTRARFESLPDLRNRVILCNPPYGVRLEQGRRLDGFYRSLGDFLKQRCKGSEAYIYFGERAHIKHVGLKPAWKKPMRNAGLDGRLVKYDLY